MHEAAFPKLRPAFAWAPGFDPWQNQGLEKYWLETVDPEEIEVDALPDIVLEDEDALFIPGVQGETILLGLDMQGVAASAGSACTTGNSEPSHVVLAIGRTEQEARSTIRFSVGRGNSLDEMDAAAVAVAEAAERVRALLHRHYLEVDDHVTYLAETAGPIALGVNEAYGRIITVRLTIGEV